MSRLRAIDTASGDDARAQHIARSAAHYLTLDPDLAERCYQANLAHARGIYDARERTRELYITRRAWRLAEQDRETGERFDMVAAYIADV